MKQPTNDALAFERVEGRFSQESRHDILSSALELPGFAGQWPEPLGGLSRVKT